MNGAHEEHVRPRRLKVTIGQNVGSAEEPLLQDDKAGPFIERPSLPAMGEGETEPRPTDQPPRLMAEKAVPQPGAAGRGEMAPVPDEGDRAGAGTADAGNDRPQQVREPTPRAAAPGYLRLRLRVDRGEMRLVGVSRVEGPLAPPEPVQGGLAYEVTIGQQQLGAGTVPDPGVQRAFQPLDAPEKGHFLVEVPSYEFTARVPADMVSIASLPDVHISVYRMDAGQVIQTAPDRPLRQQVGQYAEEVAALRGIDPEQLPHQVRTHLDRALR
jgi:hypothetical protein